MTGSQISHPDEQVNVICMKWGNLYGPEYVNGLFHGVTGHLTFRHRFVCFTDDATGLHPDIEVRPIPVLQMPDGRQDTRWRKLGLFSSPLADLTGPTLFLDLDQVIVGSLDEFFTYPGAVPIIRDMDLFRNNPLRRLLRPKRQAFLDSVGNSSVFRFSAGKHAHVLDRFLEDPDRAMREFRISQQFQSDALRRSGELTFWPREWCVSFKNDCVPLGPSSYVRDPVLPVNARIIVFAGEPKMTEVLAGGGHKWYRRIGRIDWLREAWSEQ